MSFTFKPKALALALVAFVLSGCAQPQASLATDGLEITAESRAVDTSTTRKNWILQEIRNANGFIASASVRAQKYLDMSVNPASSFPFFRATAHLYYKDLSNGRITVPSSWASTSSIKTWLSGDFHLQNAGTFANKYNTVKFDLNDFDESWIGPFYWDLIRFTAGIYLSAPEYTRFTLTETEATSEVDTFLTEYQNALNTVKGSSSETSLEITATNTDGFLRNWIEDLEDDRTTAERLAKWTKVSGSVRSFDLANPDLGSATSTMRSEVTNGWTGYKATVSSFVSSQPSRYFTIKDVAQRLNSGLGSRGVTKYYALIEGPTTSVNDDILLELKEVRAPNMLLNPAVSSTIYNSSYTSHASRAVLAAKILGVKVEEHLGVLQGSGRAFVVRQISTYKDDVDGTVFASRSDLRNYLKYAARALAWAHARADRDHSSSTIGYNAESGILAAIKAWSSAKTTMRNLGKDYAAQVRQDYTFFKQLLSSGTLY